MGRIDDLLESVLGLQYDIDDLDAILAAYAEIGARATVEDLPKLLETPRSDRSDFFVREMLAAPIAALGGPSVLEELLAAFQRNYAEGHDTDGMSLHLIELVEADPASAANELERLLGSRFSTVQQAAFDAGRGSRRPFHRSFQAV